ncbi:MAG: dihydrodipicolinate synthase family protein, partial [Verrucomicrobiia bacterium]
MASTSDARHRLRKGLVIPACPLALTESRRLDERRQRALFRYYIAAGAGGLAVGVHTTQFAIRDPKVGLFRPVLEIAAEESKRKSNDKVVLVGGICGQTRQAVSEAETLRELGYDAGLVSLGALRTATEDELVMHCRELARAMPLSGFYLQPAVGGRHLPVAFWRRLAELPELVAVKIAP